MKNNFNKLRNRLLAIGGKKVVELPDPHLEVLLKRGRVMEGKKPKKIHGRPNRCHHNAALFYLLKPDQYQIGNGYALAEDGYWVQHSWLWDGQGIVETTCKFITYFGVILEPSETDQFVLSQVFETLYETIPSFSQHVKPDRKAGDIIGPSATHVPEKADKACSKPVSSVA